MSKYERLVHVRQSRQCSVDPSWNLRRRRNGRFEGEWCRCMLLRASLNLHHLLSSLFVLPILALLDR